MFRGLLTVALLLVPSSAVAQIANLSSVSRYANGNVTNNILNRPTVSPYLNLLRNGGNPQLGLGGIGGTYQTLVRPQLESRQRARAQTQQNQRVQQQLNQVQRSIQSTGGSMSTGHPTRFMSYSHYYPNLGR